MKELSVVLPVKLSLDRLDLIDRLSFLTLDNRIPDSIEFVAVDDGSPQEFAVLIERKCKELGIRYLRIDSENEHFSVGRVRNISAQSLDSKFIMFQDVDLMPYDGFYESALQECYIQELDKYADRFVMFGVVYLTQLASDEFLACNKDIRKNLFLKYLFEHNKDKIEKHSTGTSVTIWRRDHYLCTGGNDPEFQGWGFEDLEYACRAMRRNRTFALPSSYTTDYRNFMTISEYKGWKSMYRLYGDMTFNKGMVLFHYWHEIDHNSAYLKQKEKNKLLFNKKIEQFAKTGVEPAYLPILSKGKTLMFKNNPWTLNRWVAPNLGEIIVIAEDCFDDKKLLSFIHEKNIDRVVFHNPYATEKMMELYFTVKQHNIDFIVCERGALRDSVFIDPHGFNADSYSYDPAHWDVELSELKRKKTLQYIVQEKYISDSLEQQNEKLGEEQLRAKLKISSGKKILFVPLQRPSDTVIKYFAGPIGSYDNFISLVNSLAHTLPLDWDIVVKRHPLEVQDPDIKGVIFANDENIKSLLEISDATLLINSGVGVLSMIYDKPVFVAGDAFYGHEGITHKVKNIQDLITGLDKFKPDREKVLRFLSFLINDFYSFGEFVTRTVPWVDGTKMTATTAINYYCVRYPNQDEMVLERNKLVLVPGNSLLFDRYRNPNGDIRLGEVKNNELKKKNNEPHDGKKIATIVKTNVLENTNEVIYMENKPEELYERVSKKITKLKNDPKSFLDDSQFKVLKFIGKVVK